MVGGSGVGEGGEAVVVGGSGVGEGGEAVVVGGSGVGEGGEAVAGGDTGLSVTVLSSLDSPQEAAINESVANKAVRPINNVFIVSPCEN